MQIEQFKTEIEMLSDEDFARLRRWFAEKDRQLEMDKETDPVKIIENEIDPDLEEHGFEQTSDEDLKRYLIAMCKVAVSNDSLRQRYLLRGFTINHLQIARLIKSLDEKNSKTERWFMVLAIGSLVIGGLGLFLQSLGLIIQIITA